MEKLPVTVVSSIGDFLPPPHTQAEALNKFMGSNLLGALMDQVRLSHVTGCMMPQLSRDHRGYHRKQSVEIARELGLPRASSSQPLHRLTHYAAEAERTGQLPTAEELAKQVDHKCRNTGCCNPNHERALSGKENNSLKDKARKVEPAVINSQGFYVDDLLPRLPWLEATVANSEDDYPEQVISTRNGPYILRRIEPGHPMVFGERVACAIFDALKPLGKNSYRRPSRKNPPVAPIIGQFTLKLAFNNVD